jgi:hypothetical protein
MSNDDFVAASARSVAGGARVRSEREELGGTPRKREIMKVTVLNCARCGEDHEMEFYPFSQNGIDDFTHWGMCPNINEPVLLKFINAAEQEPEPPPE